LAVLLIAIALLAALLPGRADATTTIGATTYTTNTTWAVSGSPYVVTGGVSVTNGATLTIQAGTIVKFGTSSSAALTFSGGHLSASGAAGAPIIFTSLADDSAGGDTGGDGPTTGAAGQWCNLGFSNGTGANVGLTSTLSYVTLRYGGKSTCGSAALNLVGSSGSPGPAVTVSNSAITTNGLIGASVNGATLNVQSSSIDHNGSDGIKVVGTNGSAAITGTTISSNAQKGLDVQSLVSGTPATSVFDSTITGNAIGVYTLLSTSLAAASWPFGHRNNIYANGGATPDQNQLYDTNASPRGNWTNNYWGSDVGFTYNYAVCGAPIGYLTYNSNTYPNQVGPLVHGSQWTIFSPSTHCFKDKTFIGPGDYSTAPFSGSDPSVALQELLGMSSGEYANTGQGLLGTPINSVTGNFSRTETDLTFPEASQVPFAWQRNYNGFQDLSSPLGLGWTGTWTDSLELLANGDLNFRSANGGRFHYTLQSGGSYKGDPGVTASLTAISGGYEVTRKDQVKLDFNSSGKLTSIKDANGQGVALVYDGSGRLSSATDSVGRQMTFSYNASSQLTGVAASDGRGVSYSYNGGGQLASFTDVRGKTWTYSYDSKDLLTQENDPRGKQVFKNVYDSYGRVTDQYDAFNSDTTFAYNGTLQRTTITDPLGKVTKDDYRNGLLIDRIDPLGDVTSKTYDSNLNVASETDPNGKTTTFTYDAAGNMLTKTAPAPLSYVKTWTYNSHNQVTSYVDGRGKTTSFTYDSAGNLTSITRPGSTTTSFTYDSAGNGLLVSMTDPRGKTTAYGYDGWDNLATVVDPDGNTTSYTYDAAGRLTSVVDPRGNVSGANPNDYRTSFTYDAAGHQLSKTDPLGSVTSSTYDDTGNQLTVTNALGKTWTSAYNDADQLLSVTAPDSSVVSRTYTVRGELASVTDELGHKTTYTYDDAGHLKTKVTPRGNLSGCGCAANYTWTYDYDANGNQLRVTDPLGHSTSTAYDVLNRANSVTDALSHTTGFSYDANDNLISKTDPLGHSVTRSYDDLNRPISITDGRGKRTDFSYDPDGNLLSSTDPLGNETTFGYDDANRVISSVDPRGNVSGATANDYKSTFGYDAAGNLTVVSDPLGDATISSFDRDGRLANKTDPLGHTTSYGYDSVGRLRSVTAPDTTVTAYGYDDLGNLTSRTDANLHTTSYGYDAARRLTSVTNPLGKVWTFAYDADNELTGREDAIAQAASNPSLGTTSYSYDYAGRQTGIDYSDSTPDVSFGYDAASRLTSSTDGAGSKSFGYDAANRLISVTRGSSSFSYQYDAANNLTQTTQPDSTVVSYGYDDAEQLASLTQGSNVTGYGYDAAGNLTSKTLPNGITETRSYDHAGRLTDDSNASATHVYTDDALTLDAAGRRTRVDRTGGNVETYTYDNLNRLTKVCYQATCPNSFDPQTNWTYDAVGNRTSESRPGGPVSFTYNAGDELTSSNDATSTTSYSYDDDGRQTAKGSSSFAYDVANNLTSATLGGTTTSYSYDGSGNRLSASDGTNTTNYSWDENTLSGLPQLARESSGSGSLVRRYISDTAGPSSMQTGSGSFYYLHDYQGSVARLTDATANTEWDYEYTPFGDQRVASKVDPSAPDNPIRFNAQYFDSGSGLYDLRARQYDAADGRFTSTDPLTPPLTDPFVSPYVYADNQPTVLADPSGMSATSFGGGFGWDTGQAAASYGVAMDAVHTVTHLMSAGVHTCESFTPWGALKHLCKPILIAVTFVNPEWFMGSEGEGLLAQLAAHDGFTAGETIIQRLISEERGSLFGDALTTRLGVAAEDGAALSTGWRVGDPIVALTRAGNEPAWSTVRARYWKNVAAGAEEGEYSAANLARMRAGRAPLHDELGVSRELHHLRPRAQGGTNALDNLLEVWPWEHAAQDRFRFYSGPVP
jgi:RHS repeat-associated protein